MSPKLYSYQLMLIVATTIAGLGVEGFMIPQQQIVLGTIAAAITGGFMGNHHRQQQYPQHQQQQQQTTTKLGATSPEEAAALTEFMARAHEEKVAAMARVEAQYKDKIAELQAKVDELEGPSTGSEKTSSNSFAFPATNRALAEKVTDYQTFISNYIVKAQAEKQKAVHDAEEKMIQKYESIIASLTSE